MRGNSTQLLAFAPVALATSYVLSVFTETGAHWTILIRPCLLALAATLAILTLVWAMSRSIAFASTFSTLAILILIQHPLGAFVIGYVCLVAISWFWFVKVRRVWDHRLPIAHPIALSAVLLFCVTSAWVVGSGSLAPWDLLESQGEGPAAPGSLPNIYVLWLDGYPRGDTLRSTYEFDNHEFLGELEAAGFAIAPDSHTEYDLTQLTLVQFLSGEPSSATRLTGPERVRELRRLMLNAPAIDLLHGYGYELVTVRSPIVQSWAPGWDRVIDSGQLNDFEVVLLSRLRMGSLLRDWVLEQQRERIVATFQTTVSIADPNAHRIVLAHIMSPHPPFLFAANGGPADPSNCWPTCGLYSSLVERHPLGWDGYRSAMTSQIAALNAMVNVAVDGLIARDPMAVVVVMSDHGTRYSEDDIAERTRSLLAIRSPGLTPTKLGAPNPDHLLERLVHAYADASDG